MKRANHVKLICPYWKDDITNNLETQKPVIYSRYPKVGKQKGRVIADPALFLKFYNY